MQKWVSMDLEENNEDDCPQKIDIESKSEQTPVDQLEVAQNEDEEQESMKADSAQKKSYNAPRQDHCFIFQIKKLTASCD